MKQLLTFLFLAWCPALFAANSAFTDFEPTQFGTSGNKIVAKSGLSLTNLVLYGVTNTGGAHFENGLSIASGQTLGWNGDTFLVRENPNTLAQRNGTTAQTNYIYNTYTDTNNYERVGLIWSANVFNLITSASGGTKRGITLDGTTLTFRTSTSANRWQMDSSGHFLAMSDNTYDIGASGANRPRTGHFGTSLVAPTGNISSNTAALFPKTNDFVIATRYTNTVAGGFGTQRAIVAASFTLNAAAAGTAKVSLYVEHPTGGLTNKLSISAGPLASLTTTEPLTLPVSPSAIFRFEDETSGAGGSVSIVPATSSWFGF